MHDKFIADISQILGDELVCIISRVQRWSTRGTEPRNVIIIIVWDAALPYCEKHFRNYLAANLDQIRQTEVIGYQQFEQSVRQGIPASIFTIANGSVLFDPKDLFSRVRNIIDLDQRVGSKNFLQTYLSQKSRGHLRNITTILQRLFAEMYLAAEASMQHNWIRQQDEISYADILEIASWENIIKQNDILENNPDIFNLVQSFIDSSQKLEGHLADNPYLGNIYQAKRKLESFIDRQLH